MFDRTMLDLLSLAIAAGGIFGGLLRYNPPETMKTFLGQEPLPTQEKHRRSLEERHLRHSDLVWASNPSHFNPLPPHTRAYLSPSILSRLFCCSHYPCSSRVLYSIPR